MAKGFATIRYHYPDGTVTEVVKPLRQPPKQLSFEDDPDYEVERFGPGGLIEGGEDG